MIVVADTSPLIVLTKINRLHVLQTLFETVTVPKVVADELLSEKGPKEIRERFINAPAWLVIRQQNSSEQIRGLDAGESAAIVLATELNAALLVIDETKGRVEAKRRNLAITGTIGVLERAAEMGLIDLSQAFDEIRKTDFWISPELLDERLRLHRQKKSQ